jgi:hypothetical protein
VPGTSTRTCTKRESEEGRRAHQALAARLRPSTAPSRQAAGSGRLKLLSSHRVEQRATWPWLPPPCGRRFEKPYLPPCGARREADRRRRRGATGKAPKYKILNFAIPHQLWRSPKRCLGLMERLRPFREPPPARKGASSSRPPDRARRASCCPLRPTMRPATDVPRCAVSAFPSLAEALARGPAFFTACPQGDGASAFDDFYGTFDAAYPADKPLPPPPANFRAPIDHSARVVEELVSRSLLAAGRCAVGPLAKPDNPYCIASHDSDSEPDLGSAESDSDHGSAAASGVLPDFKTPVPGTALTRPFRTAESAGRSILRRRPDDSPQIAAVFPAIDDGDDSSSAGHRGTVNQLVHPYDSDASPASRRASLLSRASSVGENSTSAENVDGSRSLRPVSGEATNADGTPDGPSAPALDGDAVRDGFDDGDDDENDGGQFGMDDFDAEVDEGALIARSATRAALAPIDGKKFVQLENVSTSFTPKPPNGGATAAARKPKKPRPPRMDGAPKRLLSDLDVERARKALAEEAASATGGVRRSSRQKFAVLEYWRNEHVKYERRESRLMPTLAEVVEIAKQPAGEEGVPAVRQPKRRRAGGKNPAS